MLTSAQIVDTRRFMGYSLTGNIALSGYRELVYSEVSFLGISLDTRLANMSSDEETILINKFLTPLNTIEDGISNASDSLDTDQAAVWYHNKSEVNDRTALYNKRRRDLCEFLGFAPGPHLGDGTVRVVRC